MFSPINQIGWHPSDGSVILKTDQEGSPKLQTTIEMNGKTVLITGSNRGIGLEFVSQFASQGWNVIATVRDLSKAKEVGTPLNAFIASRYY